MRKVVDLWAGNRNIDVAAWKAKLGLWGAIVKCGGHEYLNGEHTKTFYQDSAYKALRANVRASGLKIGTYYYSSATTAQEAREEAKHCLQLIDGQSFDLPVYMDVEERSQLELPKATLTAIVDAFCGIIEDAGFRAGIYSGSDGFGNMSESVCRYSLWLAYWADKMPSWATVERGYEMWQQGSISFDGTVHYADVGGAVDFNWWLGDDSEGRRLVRVNDVAASIHYDMVTDPLNGYSQHPDRWGGDIGSTSVLTINGRKYEYPNGSYDCSSSVITAWQLALQGTKYEGALDKATYTGDIREVFVGSGLFYASLSPAKRGDLYLSEGHHVAMCQDGGYDGVFGRDCLSEFNRNENGGAYNGQPGDQDGLESVMRDYYDYPWNTVLHYNGKADYYAEDETEEDMNCLIHPNDTDKIYYWDGSPECVPYHLTPAEKKAVESAYKLTHGGKSIQTVRMERANFDQIIHMTKARKEWREQPILNAIRATMDAIRTATETVAKKLESLFAKDADKK